MTPVEPRQQGLDATGPLETGRQQDAGKVDTTAAAVAHLGYLDVHIANPPAHVVSIVIDVGRPDGYFACSGQEKLASALRYAGVPDLGYYLQRQVHRQDGYPVGPIMAGCHG